MKNEKVEKLLGNLHDKGEWVIHIENLKQAMNHGFIRFMESLNSNKKLGENHTLIQTQS